MILSATMEVSDKTIRADFGTVQVATDGGYEQGYAAGQEAGYAKGYLAGEAVSYDKGLTDGQKAERDRFWDANQQKGERTSYYYGYYGSGWTDENFHPKYDIHLDANTFAYCKITDLKSRLEECGVKLDTSVQPNSNSPYSFRQSTITRLPELDLRNWEHLKYLIFDMPNLISIDKLILKDDGSQQTGGTNGIYKLPALVDIVVEGKFGDTLTLNHSAQLNANSIRSIIHALSETVTGKSVTLTKTAVNKAFETTEGANDGSKSEAWLALIAPKSNWTIAI